MLRPSNMNFPKFQPVIDRRQWKKINLRAAGALLLFLLTWLSVPAAMLAQQPDVCSMECCVAEGHCCCASQRLWVEGQDHSRIREIGSIEIESSCPCLATPSANAKVFSRQIPQTIWHELAANQPPPLIGHQQRSGYSSLHFSPRSPRAPPASFLTA